MTDIIITTGPESCGKTTLAYTLGRYCNCPVMAEVSREYLDTKVREDPLFRYQHKDLLEIARRHQAREQAMLDKSLPTLILDTDLLVILVWHLVRFPQEDSSVLARSLETAIARGNRTYLLCRPDLPWQPDPLRENPDDRGTLFKIYRDLLEQSGANYLEVGGLGDARLESAVTAGCIPKARN